MQDTHEIKYSIKGVLHNHFKYRSDQFITRVGGQDDDDWASFMKLPDFVHSFSLVPKVDRTGRLVFDADGESELEPWYISWKELVGCESADEAMILLGTHFVFTFFYISVCLFGYLTDHLFVCLFCRIDGEQAESHLEVCPVKGQSGKEGHLQSSSPACARSPLSDID